MLEMPKTAQVLSGAIELTFAYVYPSRKEAYTNAFSPSFKWVDCGNIP
jgi:hypothetical protein